MQNRLVPFELLAPAPTRHHQIRKMTANPFGEQESYVQMNDPKTLVVVNPGSLFGSAEHKIGSRNANSVRENICEEITAHKGNLVVVDTPLSDEVYDDLEALIAERDQPAFVRHGALLRLWVTQNGYAPNRWWQPAGFSNHPGIFSSCVEAARYVAMIFCEEPIVVTGGWATGDVQTGEVDQFVEGLRSDFRKSPTTMSPWVLKPDQARFGVGECPIHPARIYQIEILN